jgi:hypothetical protein
VRENKINMCSEEGGKERGMKKEKERKEKE